MKRAVAVLLIITLFALPCFVHAQADIPVIRRGNPDSMQIALTFDDGPHPRQTDAILSLLREYDIRATFFVIGENVSYYGDVVNRAVADGHEIGNHTYHHVRLSDISETEAIEEIQKTEEIVRRVTGYETHLFRPPEGAYNENALAAFAGTTYRFVLWTVDTRDWEKASTEKIVATVEKNVRGGSILLFHDYTAKGAHTLDALKILIPKLKSKGYEFVTVSELLS